MGGAGGRAAAYPAGLGPGRSGLVCGVTGLVPRSAAAPPMPMARARTAQNPGERPAERTWPAPATIEQPPAEAVTAGKVAEPAAKLSR